MPRKKKPLSAKERRRIRYKKDKKFRREQKLRSRKNYRVEHGVELETCLKSLDFVDDCATRESVYVGKRIKTLPVFNVPTTAKMLQELYQTVWRWIKKGQLPEPVLKIRGKGQPAYHLEEVRAMIKVLGRHQKRVSYYRGDHLTTKACIFDEVKKVRAKLKLS